WGGYGGLFAGPGGDNLENRFNARGGRPPPPPGAGTRGCGRRGPPAAGGPGPPPRRGPPSPGPGPVGGVGGPAPPPARRARSRRHRIAPAHPGRRAGLADALAGAGFDLEAAASGRDHDIMTALGGLLARAQRAGTYGTTSRSPTSRPFSRAAWSVSATPQTRS